MVLAEGEVSVILNHLKNNPSAVNTRNYCLIRLLYEGGLRISEALSVRFEDITSCNSGSYTVKITGKGHKQRNVYILKDLYETISLLCSSGYVFKSIAGNQLTRTAFHKTIKKLGKRLLNKNISAHCFRHSFATTMIEKHPEKLKGISSYCGHASQSLFLDMYVHNQVSVADIQSLKIA